MTDKKIIVLEGVNRCGKTHIATKISKKLDIPIFKIYDEDNKDGLAKIGEELQQSGITTVTNFYEDLITLQMLSQIDTKGIILDRSLPSEFAYGRLQYRKPLHPNILNWWFKKLKSVGGIYIWIDCGWETVQARGIKTGWLETFEDWHVLHCAYLEMFVMACKYEILTYRIDNSLCQQYQADKYVLTGILKEMEGLNGR